MAEESGEFPQVGSSHPLYCCRGGALEFYLPPRRNCPCSCGDPPHSRDGHCLFGLGDDSLFASNKRSLKEREVALGATIAGVPAHAEDKVAHFTL